MNILQHILTKLIRVYQLSLSPLVGWHCRFQPSCSEYMRQAIIEFGAVRGVVKGVRRLSRCHPWGGHGYDPVIDDSKSITRDETGCSFKGQQ